MNKSESKNVKLAFSSHGSVNALVVLDGMEYCPRLLSCMLVLDKVDCCLQLFLLCILIS